MVDLEDYKTSGDVIYHIRKLLGYSQPELAAEINVHPTSICHYEAIEWKLDKGGRRILAKGNSPDVDARKALIDFVRANIRMSDTEYINMLEALLTK